MFEYELLDRARADRKHIVLPEGERRPDPARRVDRCCSAASRDLTILGDEAAIRARATELGLDLDDAAVHRPARPASCSSGSPTSTPSCARTRA